MSESTQLQTCVSRNYCSVTEFKRKSTRFSYTWKIKNFEDIYRLKCFKVLSSESSTKDNEKTPFWSVNLYLEVYPDYLKYNISNDYHDYFSADININNLTAISLECTNYNSVNANLKVSIIDTNKIEKEVYNSKVTNYNLQISRLVKKNFVLSEENQLLPDGDLTLKFYLTTTECELLSNNPASANFSNMLIFTGLESMFNNEKFSDFVIAIGDKRFCMHKVILAIRSPVFAAMFEHDMKENIENVVEITDIDHKIMQQLLYFMYTGKVNNIEDVAHDLLTAADKYEIEELRSMCEETLVNQLNVKNVITLLIHAEKHGAKILKEKALEYFNLHVKEIIHTEEFEKELNSFIHLVPDLFKSLTI